MGHTISVFSRELSEGGGGAPSRLRLTNDDYLISNFDHALKSYSAWSPILWSGDVRKGQNFERASIVAVDWETTHDEPFPWSIYPDDQSLISFIITLRVGEAPLPDLAHRTEHGVRLIWLLGREVTDAGQYRELTQRLTLDYGGDLSATNLSAGFTAQRHLAHSSVVEVQSC